MKFTTEGSERKPRELCPEGTHLAVCYRIVDLGTQALTGKYAFDEKTGAQKFSRKINIAFEIPAERMKDGKPFNAFNTWDIPRKGGNKGKFRELIKAWINKNVDDLEVEDIFLKGAMVSIVHSTNEETGRTYDNIGGVVPLPKGMPVPKHENEAYIFSLDEFSQEVFDKLPKWQQEIIKDSVEYKRMMAKAAAPAGPVDDGSDVPF